MGHSEVERALHRGGDVLSFTTGTSRLVGGGRVNA
jgi:hypothetical protein